MRTAESIILSKYPYADRGDWMEAAIDCINEARRECLLEAASKFEDYEQVTPQIKNDIILLINELQ